MFVLFEFQMAVYLFCSVLIILTVVMAFRLRKAQTTLKVCKAGHEEMRRFFIHEIHHRVRNNLQIILSLLNEKEKKLLEGDSGIDPNVRYTLQVKIISLSNDHFCFEEALPKLYLDEFFRDVACLLRRAPFPLIDIDVDTEAVVVSAQLAIPLGLIICELFLLQTKQTEYEKQSQTFKIEYKSDEKEGVLSIELYQDEEIDFTTQQKHVVSEYHQFVEDLAHQIDGRITIIPSGVTAYKVWTIRFPLHSSS